LEQGYLKHLLVIPLSRLVTVGDRSFAVAGPRLWNTLPEDILHLRRPCWCTDENWSLIWWSL